MTEIVERKARGWSYHLHIYLHLFERGFAVIDDRLGFFIAKWKYWLQVAVLYMKGVGKHHPRSIFKDWC